MHSPCHGDHLLSSVTDFSEGLNLHAWVHIQKEMQWVQLPRSMGSPAGGSRIPPAKQSPQKWRLWARGLWLSCRSWVVAQQGCRTLAQEWQVVAMRVTPPWGTLGADDDSLCWLFSRLCPAWLNRFQPETCQHAGERARKGWPCQKERVIRKVEEKGTWACHLC